MCMGTFSCRRELSAKIANWLWRGRAYARPFCCRAYLSKGTVDIHPGAMDT